MLWHGLTQLFKVTLSSKYLNGAVIKTSANGLVGTGFASQSGIKKAKWVDIRPLHPLLSSLRSNKYKRKCLI